jgi:hypothetical protein
MSADRTFLVRDRRHRGFFMVFNDLYDKYGAKLGPYGLAVYMALSRYANRESECWPSLQRIADGTGMSRRQVMREIQKLEQLLLIEVERAGTQVNVYVLLDVGDSEALPSAKQSPTSDTQSLATSARKSLASARQSPKQDLKNKYLPEEFTSIIIH